MFACSQSGWSFPLPLFLLMAGGLGSLLVAIHVASRRGFPGRPVFLLLHVAILWWVVAAGAEIAAQASACKVFWAEMAWPGIIGTPTCWAIFLWVYVHSGRRPLPRWLLSLLCLAPLLAWLAALANDAHLLIYTQATGPVSAEAGAAIRYVHGPLFQLMALYVYGLMAASVLAALHALRQASVRYRRHYLGFVLITCLPWLANAPYLLADVTLFGFDPTPFSFMLTAIAFAWLISHRRLFELAPIAQHVLLAELPDPVLVLDLDGRVVEANLAAQRLAGTSVAPLGEPLASWPQIGARLAELLTAGQSAPVLELVDPARYFELKQVCLRQDEAELGQLLLLRDISAHYLSELKLSSALHALEQQLETTSNLQSQMREQAMRDPLTGLYNRRYLQEVFRHELARSQRDHRPLALVMIDLDHFKRLNDRFGHLAGDEVLRGVADTLRQSVRESDLVFRFGGEELLLLMPAADAADALQRTESLRQQVAEQAFETAQGPLKVTFSAGVAAWPKDGDSLDALLGAADTALYAAKAVGRNRVVTA